MFRKIVLCLAVALSAAPCAASDERFAIPLIHVRKLSQAELAGGSVEAAVWRRPASIPGFMMRGAEGFPTQQTEARIAYDNTNLYVAFRCFEQDMGRLTAKYDTRDGMVWRDDSVSLILSPSADHKGSVQLAGNVAGSMYDERGRGNAAWNGKWSFKVSKEANAWTAFVTVPFSDMETAPPGPGTVWTGNVYRRETPSNELSYWSPTGSEFQEPDSWGEIVFGDDKTPIVTVSTDDFRIPGTHELIVRASNPSASNMQIEIEPRTGEKPMDRLKLTAGPGESEQKVAVKFPLEGRLQFSAAAYDASTGETLTRMPAVLVRIPQNRTRIAQYTQIVRAHNPPDAKAREAKEAVLKELAALSQATDAAEGNAAKWAELVPKIDDVELAVRRVRCLCADKKGIGYAVGTETALRKVMKDKLFEGRFDLPARISACRNEFESVQVVIFAYDKALSNVNVSVSALVGPNGTSIAADRVQLNLVDYVKTGKPRYEVDYIGWYPDPLLENKSFEVSKGAVQPVWVTVHVPTGIPAGLYKGAVTIKPGNDAAPTTVPLEVTVWNFDLPVKHTFKTAFALFPHEIGAWWGGVSDEKRQSQYEFLLNHRLSPTNIYTPSPLPEKADIPFCVEHGMNEMCLVDTYNKDEKDRAALADMVKGYEKFLKERGWWDKAYIYGFDELGPEKYPELRDMYGWVKKTFPDLPRMCTVVPNPGIKGYVDIWVPLTANWRQDVAEQYVKDGDQVWWYVCVTPAHPYANFFIDYPAIDPRIIFWQCWKYHIPGFLYYAINLWENNRGLKNSSGDAHPLQDWNPLVGDEGKKANGDGLLVYPGPEGRFLSSIRLEAVRDGIEDWECLNILDGLVKKAEAGGKCDPKTLAEAKKILAVREEVVKSVTEYTFDPAVLLGARAEVAEMIGKLGK